MVIWNPGFENFCRDRGLTPKACRPRRARTKGKIERGVGYVKHNALAGRSFVSFEAAASITWRQWMIEVADRRIHGTTREQPAIRFERDERQVLRPLSATPPGCSYASFEASHQYRLFCRHRYNSIQCTLSAMFGKSSRSWSTRSRWRSGCVGSCIAQHARCYEPHTRGSAIRLTLTVCCGGRHGDPRPQSSSEVAVRPDIAAVIDLYRGGGRRLTHGHGKRSSTGRRRSGFSRH